MLLFWAGALLWSTAPAPAQDVDAVVVAPVAGTITPVIADHLAEGIDAAARDGRGAFVIVLDTPGGLDTSMREIVQSFLNARLPVVVFVGPAGARSASAGAIITMAAHIAAMAPGTAIGAATPVDLQGGDISDKIINDAAAYAESIAQAKGRNVTFAGEAVRKGRSVTAEEAARIDVVDLLATDVPELLRAIDGRVVELATGQQVTLRTAGASIVPYDLRGFRALLQRLADPNIAFLFLSIGTLAILYELGSAGVGGAGIVGVIMIVLAFFSLSVLPVNAVGALMMALAVALLIAEIFSPGVGVFAAGGVAALVLGGIFLFRGSVGVDAGIIVPVALSVGAATAFIGRFAWSTRNRPSISGEGSLIGERGVVQSAKDGTGRALIAGAWWNIRSDRPLKKGRSVRVTGIEGLDLIVEHIEEEKT